MTATGRPVCRHCGAEAVTRPRGLGWRCYYSPGVRDRYPSGSKYARRGVRNFAGPAPLPAPTAALPGTAAKVAVLAARAERGEALFHPRDGFRPEVRPALLTPATDGDGRPDRSPHTSPDR